MSDLQFLVGFVNTRRKDQKSYATQKKKNRVVKLKNKALHNRAIFEIKTRSECAGSQDRKDCTRCLVFHQDLPDKHYVLQATQSFLGFSTCGIQDSSYIVRAQLNQASSYFSHVPTYFKLSEQLLDKEQNT